MEQSQPFGTTMTDLHGQPTDGRRWGLDQVVTAVYDELKALAHRHLIKERRDHTLQSTALANEAFLRLAGDNSEFTERSAFLAAASVAIRRILVEHARRKLAAKRGGRPDRVPLDQAEQCQVYRPDELIAVDEALHKLVDISPRQAQVVELRFFAGLGIEEVAEVLGTSHATVERDWGKARDWLFAHL